MMLGITTQARYESSYKTTIAEKQSTNYSPNNLTVLTTTATHHYHTPYSDPLPHPLVEFEFKALL